jgi:hypothetical protein
LAGGDPFVGLGTGLAAGTLEQKKVTVLVDVAAPEAEMPVDDADRTLEHQMRKAGLLAGLTQGGVGRRFPVFQVALGKTPVVVGIADEQEPGALLGHPAEDDPARAHFQIGPPLAHQNTEILRYLRGLA